MRKISTPLLACLLVLSMSVTAFAAEQPQTVIDTGENGTSITITDITPREDEENAQTAQRKANYKVGSFYPVEIQTAEEDGVRLLVKTFLVPQDTDPATLIEEGLTRRGVEYQVSDILKRELAGESESKTVTETVTVPAETDDADELAELFTGTIPYSQDGFAGTLTLEPASIKTKATDTEGYAYTLKDVKEFSGLDRMTPIISPRPHRKTASSSNWRTSAGSLWPAPPKTAKSRPSFPPPPPIPARLGAARPAGISPLPPTAAR